MVYGRYGKALFATPWRSRTGVRGNTKRRRPKAVGAGGKYRTGGFYHKGRGRGSIGNQELKFLDTHLTGSVVSSFGSVVSDNLVLLPTGASESQRVGRKAVIRSIELKLLFDLVEQSFATSSFAAAEDWRFYVILDKQANGAAGTFAQVFQSASAAPIRQYLNLENKSRFRILKELRGHIESPLLTLTSSTADLSTVSPVQKQVSCMLRFKKGIPVEYSGGTGGLSEIRSNNILLMAVSENGILRMDGNIRVRYTDA